MDRSTLHSAWGTGLQQKSFLWVGVTGHPSPDRMDLSMNQSNLQVRKPSVCIGGLSQRKIVLYIRDVFCIMQASSPARDHEVPEGAAVVRAAVLLLWPWGHHRLHGATAVKERVCLPWTGWQGCAGVMLQV